ncbi:MAG: hypothetical protein IJ224_04155 [Lachnospiraceae bacterium]|nr:hypothetical protein [Lachnospiraceae bacterium]
MNNLDKVRVNEYAEIAVVQLLGILFYEVAYLDEDTIIKNVKLACAGETHEKLRTINVKIADYVLNNFGIIFIGLIINGDFREVFVEAVSIECALDNKKSKEIDEIREEMKGNFDDLSDDNIVINLEKFDGNGYKEIIRKVSDSFKRVEYYNDAIDLLINELKDSAKMDIGFCASNFMYAFRAVAKDRIFFDYINKVVESVKDELDLL